MRKVLVTVIGGLLAAALLASPAHATKPLVVEDIRFDGTTAVDPDLSEACGFEVSVSTTGHFRGTVYFDKDGNFRLFTGHPSLSDTLTSPYASIETSDRGLDKTKVNPDGTVLIFGTGIHLRVKGQVYAIGLWRLTIDPRRANSSIRSTTAGSMCCNQRSSKRFARFSGLKGLNPWPHCKDQ